jgi:hypothetical protein
MLIRISTLTGAVAYEIADTPLQLVSERGETFVAVSLTNVRSGGHAELMLRPNEIDQLYAGRRKLTK